MAQIKIIVAGNNYLLGKGLECLIEDCKDFKLLANVLTDEALVQDKQLSKADVLLMDLSTITFKPELIQQIKEINPSINILAFNNYQPKAFVAKALENGITSYLMLHCDKEEITQAIYKTAGAERFLCGWVVEVILGSAKKSEYSPNCPLYAYCDGVTISDREMDIIKCVAEGCSNQEIAEKLFLSVHTVTTHRKNIMRKLGINNTAGLVMYAVREQLISTN